MTTDTNRYRSGLERRVASQLKAAGSDWEFETEKIEYLKPSKPSKYNPDFIIKKKDGSKIYIEAKGRFLTADRQKHLCIRDQHPELDIRFVFQRAMNTISKTSTTTYAKWAEDKGFKWSDNGKIPDSWLRE